MSYWSNKFNALPDETREIACAVGCNRHIRDLMADKEFLIKAHKKHLKEINDRIKHIEQWRDREFPVPPQ